MERIIKFRAWDIEENLMAKEIQTMYDGYCVDEQTSDNYGWMSSFNDFLNERFVVMQYVDFKDQNGIEIYENDIVTLEEEYYQVVVDEDTKMPVLILDSGHFPLYKPLYKCARALKVAGNIFEDGDLLGERL